MLSLKSASKICGQHKIPGENCTLNSKSGALTKLYVNSTRLGDGILLPYFEKLNALRSQKEAGLAFNFRGAVYSIIPKTGEAPRFMQPLRSKSALNTLIHALIEAKENNSTVIAAWVGQYRTDMFLIDDIDLVVEELSKSLQ